MLAVLMNNVIMMVVVHGESDGDSVGDDNCIGNSDGQSIMMTIVLVKLTLMVMVMMTMATSFPGPSFTEALKPANNPCSCV